MASYNAQTNTIDATEDEIIYHLEKGQNLIRVSSIPEEKIYIGQQYPDFEMLEQKLIKMDTGSEIVPVDLIRVNTSVGEKIFYFDVSELFKQYENMRNSPSTDYNKIYDYFRSQIAKHWQSIYPGKEVPKSMVDMLFMHAVRTFTDNQIIWNGRVGMTSADISKEVSDKGVNDFINMAKSVNKSEQDKAIIQDFMQKTKEMYETLCAQTPEKQAFQQNLHDKTDFDILRDFITQLHCNKGKNVDMESFTRRYIGYWCQIHIEHVQNLFPPARFCATALNGCSMGVSMVIGNVITNMKKLGTHFTMGDFYSDMFVMLAPGISKRRVPKIPPNEAKKSVLSEMCNPKIFANFCAQMQEAQETTKPMQQMDESPIYGVIFVLFFIGILAALLLIQ